MLKKILMSGLLMLAFTTVEAGDFAPFGIKIGSQLNPLPKNIEINSQDYISVTPPHPVPQFFDHYDVRLNATKQVEYVSASGSVKNRKYSCLDIGKILRDQFVKNYPQAKSGSQYNSIYSFEVKNGDDLYMAYVKCYQDDVIFVMYNPFLETDYTNDPDLKGLDLKL